MLKCIHLVRNAARLHGQGCSWFLEACNINGIFVANEHAKTRNDLIDA